MKRQITIHSVSAVRGCPGVPRNHGIEKTASMSVARNQILISTKNDRNTY
jgi:hypothetical protein